MVVDLFYKWTLVYLGFVLFVGSVVHPLTHLHDWRIYFLEVSLSTALSIGLIVTGYRFARRMEEGSIIRITKHAVAGAIFLASTIVWLVFLQALEGATFHEPYYALIGAATIGGCGGTAVGYYRERAVRNAQMVSELREEQIDEFTSILSHDLRSPLSVAQGRVELAQETGDLEHLAAVESALDRIESIAESVLSLARQDPYIQNPERVQLKAVVEAAAETTGMDTAKLQVHTDLELTADPEQLRTLFENLFRNAIEHGGTDVTIQVGTLAEGNGFYVADDGSGIPSEERDHIFEAGVSYGDGGTGLGLSIVKRVVEAHGWSIAIADSESGGARFEITTG